MLNRLTGRFKEIRKYSDISELAKILSALKGGNYRVHIYDESGKTLIVYVDTAKETVKVVGVDEKEELIKPPKFEELSRGYVEIFEVTEEGIEMDKEVLEQSAQVLRKKLEKVVEERPYPESTPQKESEGGILADMVRDLSGLIDNNLSITLTKPSGIAKIILASEEYVFKRLNYEEAVSLLLNYMKSDRVRYVAIKLVSGNNAAWVIRLGNKVGIALIRDGKPVLWGSSVATKAERIEEYVKRVTHKKGYVDLHIYIMPESFVI